MFGHIVNHTATQLENKLYCTMNTINLNTDFTTLEQLEKEGKVNAELKKEAISEIKEQPWKMKIGN